MELQEVRRNDAIRKLIDKAAAEVGTREDAANNTGERIVEFQGATWLAPGAWPWCAAFTCWLMREWLEDESVRTSLNLGSFSLAEKWRCRDASAFGWEKWARQRKLRILPESEKLGPAIFWFSISPTPTWAWWLKSKLPSRAL